MLNNDDGKRHENFSWKETRWTACRVVGKYKEMLFQEICKRAESGSFEITIYKVDTLNNQGFIDFQKHREKVMKELEKLGYEATYSQGSYQSDGDDKCITIKW